MCVAAAVIACPFLGGATSIAALVFAFVNLINGWPVNIVPKLSASIFLSFAYCFWLFMLKNIVWRNKAFFI